MPSEETWPQQPESSASDHRRPCSVESLMRRAPSDAQGSAAAHADPAVSRPLSDRLRTRLLAYAMAQPLTSPSRLRAEPRVLEASYGYDQANMPVRHPGPFWGGSAFREGTSRALLTAKPEDSAAIAADAYLLAKRQMTESALFAMAGALVSLESLVHAYQTRQATKACLRERGLGLHVLRRIDFSKMSLDSRAERTLLRNGTGIRSRVLPRNTAKTRKHLDSVFGANNAALARILDDRTNYVGYPSQEHLEGATLSETGWQRITSLALQSGGTGRSEP